MDKKNNKGEIGIHLLGRRPRLSLSLKHNRMKIS